MIPHKEFMHIHEYQAKKILLKYNIPVPAFEIASNETEVRMAVDTLGLSEAVVKVQIHAGGRGKAGGVKFAKGKEEIVATAKKLIGMHIVNNQTGPKGVVAEKVLISGPISIEKEYYVAVTIDRKGGMPILIISPEGGMEIEEVAEKSPEKVMKLPVLLDGRIRSWHLVRAAKLMGWEGELKKQGIALLTQLSKAFIENDGALLEINPLVKSEGRLIALDAKFTLDDNAFYRQREIASFYDPSQSTPNEVLAKEYDLAYIGLEGEIGCLVNGAGLAMATMDIIDHYGGRPANFLDVGGGASKEEVAHGFKIILFDPKVRSIFVNIFGGIMDCGVLAEGIIHATKQDGIRVPLIVRMEGTNVEVGKKLLKESGLNIITADTMAEGAIKAVEAARGG
jgi:succinyl-CoA synthetase beta subunit